MLGYGNQVVAGFWIRGLVGLGIEIEDFLVLRRFWRKRVKIDCRGEI